MSDGKHWRQWLETAGSGVDSYVGMSYWDDPDWQDVTFKVADCNRSVSLSFSWQSEGQRKTMLRKALRLREGVDRLVAHIENGEVNESEGDSE